MPDAGEPLEQPRRYPSTIGGAFYIVILIVALGGIGWAALTGEWRLGVRVLSGALGAAALLRLVPTHLDLSLGRVLQQGYQIGAALHVHRHAFA